MLLVAAGRMNKQVAGDIGISEITTKFIAVRPCVKLARERWPRSSGWPTWSRPNGHTSYSCIVSGASLHVTKIYSRFCDPAVQSGVKDNVWDESP